MIVRIGFATCSVLFLAFALVGGWAAWEETSLGNSWTLDDPVRIFSDFDPQEKLSVSFRLHNTARKPLRILGGSAC